MRWDFSQFSPYEKKKMGKRRSKSQSSMVSQCTLTQMERETTGKDKKKKSNRGKHVARFEKWKKDTDKTLDSTNMEDSI